MVNVYILLDSLQSTYKIFTAFISGLSHFTDEVKVTMLVVSPEPAILK